MSAGGLGRELLSEVKEERLDELLRSLRALNPPRHQYHIGVQALDDLISVFHPPKPALHTTQESTTWTAHSAPPKLIPETRPPVIELAGAAACSGKTQLLYHITALALLPRQHNTTQLPGKEAAVVLFDLSSTFSILRLHSILRAQITSAANPMHPHDLDTLIHSSLQHLHIYRPQSLAAFLTALDTLPSYLLSLPPTHLSAARPLGLLAISNLSAFFHASRLEAEDALFQTQHRHLVASLRALQDTFTCPVLATNMTLYPRSEGARIRPHMPSVWNGFVSVKLVLQRDRVRRFGPEACVREVEGERAMRWEAVREAGFRAWVDWWGSEGWREGERVGVRRWERERGRGGALRFEVGDGGVVWRGEGEEEEG